MKLVFYYIWVTIKRAPSLFSYYILRRSPSPSDVEGINSGTSELGKRSVENFVNGPYNCSEAMVVAYAEREGLDLETAAGLSAAFAGGIAGKGKTCGSLLAGMMILGHQGKKHGLKKGEIRALSAELYDSFNLRYRGVDCDVISAHDCEDPNAVPFDIRNCGKFMDYSINEAEEIIKRHTGKPQSAPVASA